MKGLQRKILSIIFSLVRPEYHLHKATEKQFSDAATFKTLAKFPKVLKKEFSFTDATGLFPYPPESTRKPLVFYFQRVQKENSGTKYVKETTTYVCTIIYIASTYLCI